MAEWSGGTSPPLDKEGDAIVLVYSRPVSLPTTCPGDTPLLETCDRGGG